MDPPPVTQISWSALEVDALIGAGGYGDVYSGHWHGTPVAIKQLHLKVLSGHLIEEFQKEADIMSKCRFPQIVQLFGICLEPGRFSLVMEFMPKGSLYNFLHNKSADIPWSQRYSISLDICKGISYLHSQNILHRDLKSRNILLDEQLNAKICGLGLPKIKLESTQRQGVGSIRWRAPESFKRGFKHATSTEIYSYGMTLWEIASREIPFADEDDDVVVMGWLKDGEKEELPKDCPAPFGEIINKCWAPPDTRPDARDLLLLLQQAKPAPCPKPAPVQEKSWHFDPLTERSSAVLANPNADYLIIDASPKDKQKALSFYQAHPVPGYEISSVKMIYNRDFNLSFNSQLKKLQNKKGNPSFLPSYGSMSNPEFRDQQLRILQDYAKPYVDPDYPDVLIVPAWHGTKPDILDSIFKIGYSNLATTDSGFFGKGLYSAFEAEYAHRLYSRGALILNWVACYLALPVIDGDMPLLEGRSNFSNYDAHFVPIVPRNPGNPNESVYFACKHNQNHQYTEIVVFQTSACLPRYLVELSPTLIQNPKPVVLVQDPMVQAKQDFDEGMKLWGLKTSEPFLKKAAAKGYPPAFLRLFLFYRNIQEDPIQADLYRKKADASLEFFKAGVQTPDELMAQTNLGLCYLYGIGLTKDEALAVKLFQQAAEQGHMDAQYNLGCCYHDGIGVTKDEVLAAKLFQQAAEQGHMAAQYNLGCCYQDGIGVTKDEVLAVEWYHQVAEQGNMAAQYNLGYCYDYGIGVTKDEVLAVKWYQQAAEQGLMVAQYNLGVCYHIGIGVTKDYVLAVKWYQQAAEKGSPPAQYGLALCYLDGSGVFKDKDIAIKYLRLALAGGSEAAKGTLEKLGVYNT